VQGGGWGRGVAFPGKEVKSSKINILGEKMYYALNNF
jgi:hypothetical protein